MSEMSSKTLADIVNGTRRSPMEIVDRTGCSPMKLVGRDEKKSKESCHKVQKNSLHLPVQNERQLEWFCTDTQQGHTESHETNTFALGSSNEALPETKRTTLDRKELKYNKLLRDNNGKFLIVQSEGCYAKVVFNFYNPTLYECKSTDDDDGVYQLVLQLDGRLVNLYLLQRKCGQISYLMKKLRENGGVIYIQKPSIMQSCIEQFWEFCLNTKQPYPVIIPIRYGWCIVGGKIYFCRKGATKLWKEIVTLAR